MKKKIFTCWVLTCHCLVSVKAGDGKLVIPADAGRLVNVSAASLKTYEYEIDWLDPILAAMAHNTKVLAVVDTKIYRKSQCSKRFGAKS